MGCSLSDFEKRRSATLRMRSHSISVVVYHLRDIVHLNSMILCCWKGFILNLQVPYYAYFKILVFTPNSTAVQSLTSSAICKKKTLKNTYLALCLQPPTIKKQHFFAHSVTSLEGDKKRGGVQLSEKVVLVVMLLCDIRKGNFQSSLTFWKVQRANEVRHGSGKFSED